MNRRQLVIVALVLAAVAMLGWELVRSQLGASTPERTQVSASTARGSSEELARVRLAGDLAPLDSFVAAQRTRCAERGRAEDWRVLGEALLERCLLRDRDKGMAVGRPTHTELPEPNRKDIDAGLEAIDKAVALGDTDPDAERIRSALLSLTATGWMQILSLRPRIEAALRAAEQRDPNHPRVVIARACEKLFAPNRFLGQDIAAAERMLLRAAEALKLDERPYVLAAMGAHLLGRTEDAKSHLRKALERNPSNRYAREVLRRIEAREDDPFGRDVN